MENSTLQPPVPLGITASALPNGKVQLLLPPENKRKALQDMAVGVVVCGFMLAVGSGRAIASFIRRGNRVALTMIAVFVSWLAGYLLLQFLLRAFGSREWAVGPDYLEVTRKLWGVPWKRRYTNATLKLQMLSNPHVVAFALTLHRGGKKTFLSEFEQQPEQIAHIRALGAYLASLTGWPLQD